VISEAGMKMLEDKAARWGSSVDDVRRQWPLYCALDRAWNSTMVGHTVGRPADLKDANILDWSERDRDAYSKFIGAVVPLFQGGVEFTRGIVTAALLTLGVPFTSSEVDE